MLGLRPTFHVIGKDPWNFGFAIGPGYTTYFPGDGDSFGGWGASARLFGAIFLKEHIGVGLEGTLTYATFDGGAYESDPTMTRRPFALYEVGVGVAVTGRF